MIMDLIAGLIIGFIVGLFMGIGLMALCQIQKMDR